MLKQTVMTPQQILKEVSDKADARFGDTVERLLFHLRNQHAHHAWDGQCYCQYCSFIRTEYVPYKMQMHKLKKRIRYWEWANNDPLVNMALDADMRLTQMTLDLCKIKEHKKALKSGHE